MSEFISSLKRILQMFLYVIVELLMPSQETLKEMGVTPENFEEIDVEKLESRAEGMKYFL